MTEHAPGWYEHEGERRYWDGSQWTHATSGSSSTSSPGQPSGQPSGVPSSGAVPPPSSAYPPPSVGHQVAPYAPTYGAGAPTYGASPYGAGAPPFGQGAPQHPGGPPVARKEPAIALIVSFFLPGVGSMMNGDVGAGVGFLGLYVFGLVLLICLGWLIVGFVGVPLMIVAWGWGMYHAYQGAVDFNRRAGYQN